MDCSRESVAGVVGKATWFASLLGVTALCSAGLGCGETAPQEARAPGSLIVQNILDPNGLATNGLATNGLATNGLATNGAFATWLNEDPTVRAELMKYIVLCAVPAGERRTYVNPTTGESYTWDGQLGLTPSWAAGNAATQVEEQLVSACLAAHANPYGLHVNFSLLGRNALGEEIPYSTQELSDYSERESCFFGNLFENLGLYGGNDRNSLDADESTVRGCGLSKVGKGTNPECAPIFRIGACEQALCTMDPSGLYYTVCAYHGAPYRPLTTRILPSAINTCGDGVCQVTEQCGKGPDVGSTPDNCGLDCGLCPQ